MSILDRLLDAATGARYGRKASALLRESNALRSIAQAEPWRFSPIGPTLQEFDSETIDWLMNSMAYETIGYLGGKPTLTATESDRIACVKRIRHLYCYDALINRSVSVWTDYGFGEDIALTVTAEGESKEGECQALWDAFWNDPENEPIFGARHLQELSNQLLVDGELFMALFTSKSNGGDIIGDGKVVVRLVPTEQITELIAQADDNATPGYFKRSYLSADGMQQEIYYPNLQATPQRRKRAQELLPPGARLAEKERPGTDVVMLQVPFKIINGRGWPLPSASYRWAEEYTQFLRDRAAINRSINAYTAKAKVKGGSRGVAAVQRAFASTIGANGYETNPPAGAGSTLVTNEAVDWTRLPMASGASDARVDGMALLSEYAAGVSLPPFLLGRTDTMQNRATADTSLRPTLRAWNRYQTFWGSVFTDLCNYVLDMAEQYGVKQGVAYTERKIMVNLDSPLETDFYELTKAVNESVGASTLRAQEATRVLLERPELNIPDPAAVWDEMYGENAPAETPAAEPEVEPNTEPTEELHSEMLVQLAREAWLGAPSEEQRLAARIFAEENSPK
jgi:hypothetical protein